MSISLSYLMEATKDMSYLKVAAVGVTSLAIVVVVSIAVLGGFKQTDLIENATVDLFIDGLVYFGLFIGVLVLAIIGKVIIKLFSKNDGM